jgi:signal transduction histidine kinase
VSRKKQLVNAARHAAGQPVAVWLDYADTEVTLVVRNPLAPDAAGDGAASARTADPGYGLTGMQERLRMLNGTLEAGCRGAQWIVTAQLPRSRPETMAS